MVQPFCPEEYPSRENPIPTPKKNPWIFFPKHSDNPPNISHAKTDKSNAPNAMQIENDTEVQPTSENPDNNRSEIPHTQQKFQKKSSTSSDPPQKQGRWTNEGNSPSKGKGGRGKGEGKGSRKAPKIEIDLNSRSKSHRISNSR